MATLPGQERWDGNPEACEPRRLDGRDSLSAAVGLCNAVAIGAVLWGILLLMGIVTWPYLQTLVG